MSSPVSTPGLVLHDTGALAGPVAAARWGVPAVQLSPTFVPWEGCATRASS